MHEPKIVMLRRHMLAAEWRESIRIAARFQRLGEHRNAILDAHMAFTNPAFCLGIRKDPEALIAAGIAALRSRYQD